VGGGHITLGDTAGVASLFTDFTSSNLGLPKNVSIPYYYETTPDSFGFTPNPRGFAFIARGVGDYLRGSLDPNADWTQYADRFDGKMQNQTLRNVDMRPSPEFVKAYMHHGYLKSLKEVVHFYNTRDTLCPCGPGKIEKVTCWPPPEVPQNVNKTIGDLGLSACVGGTTCVQTGIHERGERS
jgi:cytochrome c peroxidase